MARYDYLCPSCNLQFEVEHPMAEHPTITCPQCGTKAQQVFGASSIVFKGSGFYNTDSRGAKGATKATGGTSSNSGGSGSSSSSTTDKSTSSSKSDSKD